MNILRKYQLLEALIGLNLTGGYARTSLRIVYSITFISFILTEVAYFIANIHNGIDRAGAVLPSIGGVFPDMGICVYLMVNRERYYSLVNGMRDLVHSRIKIKEKESIYIRAEQRVTFGTKIIMIGLAVAPSMSFSPLALPVFHWYLGKYTLRSWIYYFPVWVPFEIDTATRCLLLVLYEAGVTTCSLFVSGTMITLLFGLLMYTEACLFDIESLFGQVDMLSKAKPDKSKPTESAKSEPTKSAKSEPSKHQNRELGILQHCKQAAELHEQLNQCMNVLARFMNTILFVSIMPWTICICGSLLIMDKYSGDDIFYDLQMPFLACISVTALLFILFNLGQLFHSKLKNLGDTIYQTEWHRYSRNARRFVQLMIMRSQRPFFLSAFGIISLNLENYVGVLKWIYSALMLLRSMD